MTAARQRVVTNTMLRPDRTPIVGKTVRIQLNNPTAGWEPDHVDEITNRAAAVTDQTGKWSVTLDCNVDIEDGSSFYTVSQASGEIWSFVVPVGDFAVPVQLRDILTIDPQTGPTPVIAVAASFDGGGPDSVYLPDQYVDFGGVTV